MNQERRSLFSGLLAAVWAVLWPTKVEAGLHDDVIVVWARKPRQDGTSDLVHTVYPPSPDRARLVADRVRLFVDHRWNVGVRHGSEVIFEDEVAFLARSEK